MSAEVGLNPVKLTAIIRYHLSELGARNAHHEFEHLARHVARARIASNILPATGPVSSGGDGGRDFETFATRYTAPGLPGNTFSARSRGDSRLAFACSLEKKIEAKIRKDVQKVALQEDVDEIVYFCEPNVPIAKRLKLIGEAKEKGLVLQIFDGTAIAEWLSEPSIFWIAKEYLHLPSEIAPASIIEEGYVASRRAWKVRTPLPVSRADFQSIKAGLRKATFDDAARADLGFWLKKMGAFLSYPAPRELTRDAMYEIAVANLRGRGDLTPTEALVADYFSDVPQHTSIGEITDAVVLLTYCFGGYGLGQYAIDLAELFARRKILEELFEQWLAQPGIGPGRRSGLLRIRGSLEFTPAEPGHTPDLSRGFGFWNQMLDCAADAPLYPIEEFSDHLALLITLHGEIDELLALASRADELLAKRAGSAVAGEKAVDRALGFLKRGERAAAIRELHKAKMKWFSGERLEGMLRILLLLAEQYREFGLAYAAKNHSLAAAYIARYEDPDRVGEMLPSALLDLADDEDAAGNSLGFLQMLPMLLGAHIKHDPRPFDEVEHPRIHENLGQLAALLGFLKRSNPRARKCVDALASDWPLKIREPIWKTAALRNGFWNRDSWEKAWADLEEAMLDRPFGDLGPMRRVSWSALGIDWRCEFANDYATTPGAEQLISELQIAACAMAGRDLGVVPCAITLEVRCDSDATKLKFVIPDNGGCNVSVRLPPPDRGPEGLVDTIALLVGILRQCSVLSDEALLAVFDNSVFEPIFVCRPYAELYRELMPAELFAEHLRVAADHFEPEREFQSRAGDRVPWFDGPEPTYEREQAQLAIVKRYKQTLASLRNTLPRLLADPEVMAYLMRRHEQGMKDWEILCVLSNIAMNHRITQEGELSPEQWQQRGLEIMNSPEPLESVLDPALFSEEQFDIYAHVYRAAFLAGCGLLVPNCLSNAGLERFLVARYRLREDDVEHADIFGWSGVSAHE